MNTINHKEIIENALNFKFSDDFQYPLKIKNDKNDENNKNNKDDKDNLEDYIIFSINNNRLDILKFIDDRFGINFNIIMNAYNSVQYLIKNRNTHNDIFNYIIEKAKLTQYKQTIYFKSAVIGNIVEIIKDDEERLKYFKVIAEKLCLSRDELISCHSNILYKICNGKAINILEFISKNYNLEKQDYKFYNNYPLSLCAQLNNLGFLRYLIEEVGLDYIDIANSFCFEYACSNNYINIIEYIINCYLNSIKEVNYVFNNSNNIQVEVLPQGLYVPLLINETEVIEQTTDNVYKAIRYVEMKIRGFTWAITKDNVEVLKFLHENNDLTTPCIIEELQKNNFSLLRQIRGYDSIKILMYLLDVVKIPKKFLIHIKTSFVQNKIENYFKTINLDTLLYAGREEEFNNLIKRKISLECPICCEDVDFETFCLANCINSNEEHPHLFHKECLIKSVKISSIKQCPICRGQLADNFE